MKTSPNIQIAPKKFILRHGNLIKTYIGAHGERRDVIARDKKKMQITYLSTL